MFVTDLSWYIYTSVHRAATEVDDELDNLNADVFPGIHSDCLYFAVESIEFDLSGTL